MDGFDAHEGAVTGGSVGIEDGEEEGVFGGGAAIEPLAEFGLIGVGAVEEIAPEFGIAGTGEEGGGVGVHVDGDNFHVLPGKLDPLGASAHQIIVTPARAIIGNPCIIRTLRSILRPPTRSAT